MIRYPALLLGVVLVPTVGVAAESVSFHDEVLPILSDRCFHCHGPDEASREAELRLDLSDSATEDRGGYAAVAPGDADASEVIARVVLPADDSMRMPPPESGKPPLTAKEVTTLRRWIEGGAKWEPHWSFTRIERPEPPEVLRQDWPVNPIDRFVLAKLEAAGFEPSPDTDRRGWLRRAALALTGLPPASENLDAFLGDPSDQAYGVAADRLLASPHYGERMAYGWLDAARYADTDGYQLDENRTNWPWRDWVVNAYNANKPFDAFTIEQFAGDLLPEATQEEIVATCFHRNHLTNGEGGRDPEESRVDYVIDRVNTVGTTWLGLTLGCCQCHTHKYDPITQHEYYELTAFFNSIDENGRAGGGARPFLRYELPEDSPHREQALRPYREAVERADAKARRAEREAPKRFDAWIARAAERVNATAAEPITWHDVEAVELSTSKKRLKLTQQTDGSILAGHEVNPNNVDYYVAARPATQRITAVRLEVLPHPSHTAGGLARSNSGNIVLTGVEIRVRLADKKDGLPVKIARAEADYEQPGWGAAGVIDDRPASGWAVWSGDIARPRTLLLQLAEPIDLPGDAKLVARLKHESRSKQHHLGRFRLTVTDAASPSLDLYRQEPLVWLRGEDPVSRLSDEQRTRLLEHFVDHDGEVGMARGGRTLKQLELERAERNTSVRVMVLGERDQPRKTHVLERGVWDQHGDRVSPDVPDALGELPDDKKRDRLALAEWLVSRDNPLTARVAVNRYWQNLFGHGLVRTPEDFGLQGERPTHPELLDWLAAEFIESGWDIKHVHRLIVTSRTFRQSSRWRPELAEIDPENRLLARGPRFRLPAPVLRDQALAASGLLTRTLGGAPVFPYQPKGVWEDANQGKFPYNTSTGPDQHRRSLYGFWRRNAAPPAMFDAADRRVCRVNVVRTNSPMHALNLLNDPTYVEAARALAEWSLQEGGVSTDDQLRWAFARVLARPPRPEEYAVLARRHGDLLDYFAASPTAAEELIRIGDTPASADSDPVRLAAMTATMSLVLNLDETLNLE